MRAPAHKTLVPTMHSLSAKSSTTFRMWASLSRSMSAIWIKRSIKPSKQNSPQKSSLYLKPSRKTIPVRNEKSSPAISMRSPPIATSSRSISAKSSMHRPIDERHSRHISPSSLDTMSAPVSSSRFLIKAAKRSHKRSVVRSKIPILIGAK